MKSLRGLGVALITPFKKDLSVDVPALNKLVEYNIQEGADFLVVLGTTGESATLTSEEKELVIETIINTTNKRVPLVLGVGGNDTEVLKKQVADKEKLAPFDAILSVSPYYNRPSQEGIYQHYKALAEVTVKPIIMYNVPSRTGSNMAPETIVRLANEFDTLIGIKEAGGDMDKALRILRDRPEGFLVLSGDDMLALPMVTAGGDGVISVIGQSLVSAFSQVMRDGLNGASKEAYKTHYTVMPSIDLIFEEGNPVGVKELLMQQGICENYVRLPLVKASSGLNKKIKEFLKD